MIKTSRFIKNMIQKRFPKRFILPRGGSISFRLLSIFRGRSVSLKGLGDFSKRLERAIAGSEPRFLRLGKGLQSLYDNAAHLVQVTDESVCLIHFDKEDADRKEPVIRMVQRANAELASCHEKISESLRHIQKWIEQLSHLEKICPEIEQIGKTLNVVGVNMAVESSRTEASQVMFRVLADEIRSLSQQIVQMGGNILNDSASVMSDQKKLYADIEKELTHMDRYRDQVKGLVETSASEIETLMALTSGRLDQSAGHFQKISDQVGQVVVGLQFHDIIRQRVEHIVQTLYDVKRLHRGEMNDAGLPRKSVRRLIHRLLALQTEQLGEVSTDLEMAWRQMVAAFDKLGHDARAFAADAADFGDSIHLGGEVRSKINALNESLKLLHQLLARGRQIEEKVQALSAHISDTASGLANYIEQVRNICMSLRLKALNAIIKSDLLQHQGRALEVLAQEVNLLSVRLDNRVTKIIDVLEKLIKMFPEWKTEESKWSAENLSFSIQDILDRSQQCENNMVKILQDADMLTQSIDEARLELPFLEDLTGTLQMFSQELAGITEKTDPWGGRGSSEEDAEVERIALRYTMAGERDVHRQHNVKFKEKAKVPALEAGSGIPHGIPPDSGEADSDDMGDNVELF